MSDKARGIALGVAGSLLVAGLGGAMVVNATGASGQAAMVGAVTTGEISCGEEDHRGTSDAQAGQDVQEE